MRELSTPVTRRTFLGLGLCTASGVLGSGCWIDPMPASYDYSMTKSLGLDYRGFLVKKTWLPWFEHKASGPNVIETQHRSQWCWAATVANICAVNNHPISQETIVQRMYGGLPDWPAFNTTRISATLNNDWTDKNGKSFHIATNKVYDAMNPLNNRPLTQPWFNNADIVTSISQNRPLFYADEHHARMLIGVEYAEVPLSPPDITAFYLWDPWPMVNTVSANIVKLTGNAIVVHPFGTLTYLATCDFTDLT